MTPLEALTALRTRLTQTLAGHGLDAVEVLFVPAADASGAHQVHIVATVAPEELPDRTCVEEFEQVLRSTREADIEQRAADAADALRRQLNEGGGILPPPTSDNGES